MCEKGPGVSSHTGGGVGGGVSEKAKGKGGWREKSSMILFLHDFVSKYNRESSI